MREGRRIVDISTCRDGAADAGTAIYSASKAAIEQRLTVVSKVAEQALEGHPEPLNTESVLAATSRVFWQISGNWRSERV